MSVDSTHLEQFDNGASRLQWTDTQNDNYDKFIQDRGFLGHEPSGNELANDENGSCFWIPQENMNDIYAYHDSKIAEHELGFDEGSMKNQLYYRVDNPEPFEHNARVATGYEPGANIHFTGNSVDSAGNNIVDPQIYNGMTSGGQPECVTNTIPPPNCSFSPPQNFNDPQELTRDLCADVDSISKMPSGLEKDAAKADWIMDSERLDDRMKGEQEYLSSRSQAHEDRMNQFEEGSLEYNRSRDNKEWCDNYCKELGESRQILGESRDLLLNKGQTNDADQFNPTDYIPQTEPASTPAPRSGIDMA